MARKLRFWQWQFPSRLSWHSSPREVDIVVKSRRKPLRIILMILLDSVVTLSLGSHCYVNLPVISFCYPEPLVSSPIFLSPRSLYKTLHPSSQCNPSKSHFTRSTVSMNQLIDFGSVQIFSAKLRLECWCSQVKWGLETNRAKRYKPPPPLFLAL